MTTFLVKNNLFNLVFGIALLTANLMMRQTAASLFGNALDTSILTSVTACGIFASLVVIFTGVGDFIVKERRGIHFVISFFVASFVFLAFSVIT